jgi:uncharacterized protein YceK
MKKLIIAFMFLFVMSGCVEKIYATSSTVYSILKKQKENKKNGK